MTVMTPLIDFLPYQQKWLDDSSRFKIGMFARQTGKTLTNAAEILSDCLHAELKGHSTRWIVLSKGERQAREMMENYLKPLTQAFLALMSTQGGKARASFAKNEIRLPGGSRISALPAHADAARGFSANLYLDEFAFHRDSDKIWQALYPVISAPMFKIRITSTPAGKHNKFYQLMQSEHRDAGSLRWSRHVVDIHEAVKQGLPRDIDALREAAGDDLLWRQEYELDWLDDKHAWLDYALIMACEDDEAGQRFHGHGTCIIGIDVAHKRDLFVLAVVENVADILWCREIHTARDISFAAQEALLEDFVSRYRPHRIVIDATGMGAMPAERAQKRYGHIVAPIHFTAARKLHLASALKAHFQNRSIRIPQDKDLRQDLHAPQLMMSPAGTPMLKAAHGKHGHADRFWALAMAAQTAQTADFTIDYQGVSR